MSELRSAQLEVCTLTRYGQLGASSRVRMLQYVPLLAGMGWRFTTQALLDDGYLQAKYVNGRAQWHQVIRAYLRRAVEVSSMRRNAQLLWVEKELWPWAPAWVERLVLAGLPLILDFDDAIFHNYDLHPRGYVRRFFGKKIDRLMRSAALVTAGNEYLAERARSAGASRVEILPTVVDLSRYPHKKFGDPNCTKLPLVIVWIGSPSTVRYLQMLEAPLAKLSVSLPIELRVIGAKIQMPGVSVVNIPWTEAGEVAAIQSCDIGVMPLSDSPWERGKCGYKLIQYMACGLPVVGSPVGVNQSIVEPGVNGFLANNDSAWEASLRRLADDPALREHMGLAGRRRVEAEYSLQANAPRLARWFNEVACIS